MQIYEHQARGVNCMAMFRKSSRLGVDRRRGGRCVGCPQASCGSIECRYVGVVDGSFIDRNGRGRAGWQYRCDLEGWVGRCDLLGRCDCGEWVVHGSDVGCIDCSLIDGSGRRCDWSRSRRDDSLVCSRRNGTERGPVISGRWMWKVGMQPTP